MQTWHHCRSFRGHTSFHSRKNNLESVLPSLHANLDIGRVLVQKPTTRCVRRHPMLFHTVLAHYTLRQNDNKPFAQDGSSVVALLIRKARDGNKLERAVQCGIELSQLHPCGSTIAVQGRGLGEPNGVRIFADCACPACGEQAGCSGVGYMSPAAKRRFPSVLSVSAVWGWAKPCSWGRAAMQPDCGAEDGAARRMGRRRVGDILGLARDSFILFFRRPSHEIEIPTAPSPMCLQPGLQ